MKNLLKSNNIPVLILILGGIGCALRWMLYALAVDEKNLIPLGHPLEIALWLVAAAALLLVVLGVKKAAEAELQEASETESPIPAAIGSAAAAVGIGLTVFGNGPAAPGTLGLVWKVLGILSVVSLVVAAWQRWAGKEPFFLLSAVVCVFFAVHMVSCYRTWSSNPQLQDYVFTLFACIALMLFAYQRAACTAGCGSFRILRAAGLLAVFACLVCLSGTANTVMYAAGAIWAVTNLKKPALPLPVQTEEEE